MPIHEFQCTKCQTTFEELVFSDDETVACPKCGSTETQTLMSSCCHFGGSDASSGASSHGSSCGCSGCSGGNCASCGH